MFGNEPQVMATLLFHVARIPSARLALIDNCGHLPALEQPDKLYDVLIEFLSAPSAR